MILCQFLSPRAHKLQQACRKQDLPVLQFLKKKILFPYSPNHFQHDFQAGVIVIAFHYYMQEAPLSRSRHATCNVSTFGKTTVLWNLMSHLIPDTTSGDKNNT